MILNHLCIACPEPIPHPAVKNGLCQGCYEYIDRLVYESEAEVPFSAVPVDEPRRTSIAMQEAA